MSRQGADFSTFVNERRMYISKYSLAISTKTLNVFEWNFDTVIQALTISFYKNRISY